MGVQWVTDTQSRYVL